jgi:hypothetical protein
VAAPLPSRARLFLDAHPELGGSREQSQVWPQIKANAALRVRNADLFVVGGDTLGGEDELFLDRLARGARPSSDPLSGALFLELPDALQTLVRRELLLELPPEHSQGE